MFDHVLSILFGLTSVAKKACKIQRSVEDEAGRPNLGEGSPTKEGI